MSPPTDGQHTDESPQRRDDYDPISELYKYLLLLGILVATVTFTAGLDPPGGLWQESKDGHRTGDPILHDTRRARYKVFYIFNSSAFVVSLVLVVNLLLSAPRNLVRPWRVVLKAVVVVDLILLVVAFIAGSCRGRLITLYASAHCSAVFIVVAILVLFNWLTENKHEEMTPMLSEESRKVLMLLAIFATTVTYTASLTPPGGFWEHAPAGKAKYRAAGDPILLERDLGHMVLFFVGNTTAFTMSVVIMMLLLFVKLTKKIFVLFCACIMLVMLGLVAAYIASVWRHPKMDTVIIIAFLVGDIFVYYVFHLVFRRNKTSEGINGGQQAAGGGGASDPTLEDSARDLILLLATMVASVTYQAGLQPPGGVWRGTGQGHAGGGLVLPVTHPARYKAFFFLNTAAFVTSIVVVIMVQIRRPLVSQHTLEAAVILDLLGLLGAYAAGTIRGHHAWSSACVFTLVAAGAIFLLLVASLVQQKLQKAAPLVVAPADWETRREVLMLLATMAITITYQAGLTPPGKFWLEQGGGDLQHAGDPVLVDTYPQLYKWFLFSNTATFMISVAVILFLVSRKLNSVAREWWSGLSFYTVLVLVLLMTTFIAGTKRRPITVIATGTLISLHAGSFAIALWKYKDGAFIQELGRWFRVPGDHARQQARGSSSDSEYLTGVSILAASVAYQAGLSPPGGFWLDDDHGHTAGNPVLHDTDNRRYLAFYYSNTASFAASVAVNVLILVDVLVNKDRSNKKRSTRATYMVLVLDVLGLLMAYAIGSSRDKDTWMYVLAVATAILIYIAIHMLLPHGNQTSGTQG